MPKYSAKKNQNAASRAVTHSSPAPRGDRSAGADATAVEEQPACLARLSLQAAEGNKVSICPSSGIKTHEGEGTVEVALQKLAEGAKAEDVGLTLSPEGPLEAEGRYEVSLLCRGSIPGTLFVDKDGGGAPAHEVRIMRYWQEVRFTIVARPPRAASPSFPHLLLGAYGGPATLYVGSVRWRRIPAALPFCPEWTVFLNVTAPESFDSVPGALSGAEPRTVTLAADTVNLAQLAGGFSPKDCAVLYNQFDCAEAGIVRVGVSADWWIEVYSNGRKVADGTGTGEFSPDDLVFDLPVKAGRNLLAVKILSGSGGWRFVCGQPGVAVFRVKPAVISGTFSGSRIFPGTTRPYWVCVPRQYTAAKPACLYVAQDGLNVKFIEAMDSLIDNGEMPVTVMVFVGSGVLSAPPGGSLRSNRSQEFDSLGDAYARFLIEELLPYVAKTHRLNLSQDGNDRAIGGCSSGGICAFNAAWERPDAFSRVYSNCGSFAAFRGGDDFPALVRKFEPKPIRVFLHGAAKDLDIVAGNWWLVHTQMESALAHAGYDHKAQGSQGAHGDQYAEAFPDAMRWLWHDHPAPIVAGSGSPRLQDLLIPGERWRLACEGFQSVTSLAANSKGEVFALDARANRLRQLGGSAADAKGVCALAAGADGRIHGVSRTTGQLLAFDDGGRATVLAKGVPGTTLAATRDGAFHILGPGQAWRVSSEGAVSVLDFGLPNPTGAALATDGWLLHVSDGGSRWGYLFEIGADGSLAGRGLFCRLEAPCQDERGGTEAGAGAICVLDSAACLLVASRMGVQSSSNEGRHQCVIPVPGGRVSALCLGGSGFDVLYAACDDKIYQRKVRVRGRYAFHPPCAPPPEQI